jgi:hypothetical protein
MNANGWAFQLAKRLQSRSEEVCRIHECEKLEKEEKRKE